MVLFILLLYEGKNKLEQKMEEIYQAHLETVNKYLFCFCPDKSLAEDLTQETFYIATKEINSFRNESKIEVWLCQIAKNLWYQELRRKKSIISMDTEIGEIQSDLNLEENFMEKEQRVEVYKQIEKLEGTEKELILLRLTTELTFKNIAGIIGKSEPWSRVTFYRWKRKMEEMNQKEEVENGAKQEKM